MSKNFEIVRNNDGTFNRVRILEDIFENTKDDSKSIKKIIKEYLEMHIGEYSTIKESNQIVYLGKDLPNEYAYSVYSKGLSTPMLLAKGRLASNLKEVITYASNRKWNKNKKEKHLEDAKYGFYQYKIRFSFYINSLERIYAGIILIRNDKELNKYLYDVIDIKRQKN